MSNETTPTHEWPTDSELDELRFKPLLADSAVAKLLIASARDRNRLERALREMKAYAEQNWEPEHREAALKSLAIHAGTALGGDDHE